MRKAYTGLVILAGISALLQGCSGGGGSSGGGSCVPGTGADVVVSGQVTYDRIHHNAGGGLDYNNITREPVRGAVVEAVCNSAISTTRTDAAGNYSLNIPASTINVFIRVKAQMLETGTPSWNYSVVDNSQGQAIYSMDGAPFTSGVSNSTRNLHAASGWTGSFYGETRVAAPFAILDSVYDAHHTVLNEEPNGVFPALKLNWHSDNTDGTYYDFNTSEIYILGKANNDTDEYDYHVIIHEYGHYFQDAFSRDDSVGGPHSGSDILDIRVAFSEGFGNAFSAIASGESVYADSMGQGQDGTGTFTFDLDDNGCFNPGWFSECSVQSILFDIYDTDLELGDNVELGFAPMYDVLAIDMPDLHAFSSIFSFVNNLKGRTGGATATEIDNLTMAQSIDPIGNDWGSSQSNDPSNETSNLPVYETSVGTVCSTGEHQGYNGLGVYRFIQVTGSGSVTFDANFNSGASNDSDVISSDPDLELFLKGERLATAWSADADTETLTYTLSVGETYILQVNEDTYFNPDYAPDADNTTCFDITQG